MERVDLEALARFVARNAKHNLKLIKRNPLICSPEELNKNITFLKLMIRLNKFDMKAQKNARLAGRTLRFKTLLNILPSILSIKHLKSKGRILG
ncbi:hypothetical protein [Paenibacillus pini]|uniref:Uncharacterized protein n=1 Tax=Paenibacillus pini JCM 16418 TaxID=1236976 RepID=W7YGS0_9BACL|nr:hypothetical protein [Paenibacillus pini]GAF06793.1 hypothetical protein JCM16418_775 [Paenibacillus pini JCM 16418]